MRAVLLERMFRLSERGSDVRTEAFAGPATFMTMACSISRGIGLGFVSCSHVKVASGKFGEVHPLLYVVSAAFAATFVTRRINGFFR